MGIYIVGHKRESERPRQLSTYLLCRYLRRIQGKQKKKKNSLFRKDVIVIT